MLSFLRHRRQRNRAYTAIFQVLKGFRSGRETDREAAREEMERALASPYWQVVNEGVKVLGLLCGEGARERLASLATDPRQVGFIRRNALEALLNFEGHDTETLETLSRCLEDDYWEVRTAAAKALALSGPDETRSHLLAKYLSPTSPHYEKNFEVRLALLVAYGSALTSSSGLDLFRPALADSNWKIRQAAMEGLSEAIVRLRLGKQDFLKHLRNVDLTCEDFAPQFPLKMTFNTCLEKVAGTQTNIPPLASTNDQGPMTKDS